MSIIEGKGKWIWSAVLLCVWGSVAALFWKNHGNLTVAQLLDYTPKNPALAVLVMLGLFALKSLDFVMHSGVLYAANGVMFPLPFALLLNLAGAAIMAIPPYFVGRSLGAPIARKLREKYPKLGDIEKLRLGDGGFLTALLIRVCSLPLTIASVYLGATEMPFVPYLTGSLIGLVPVIVSYALMGAAADDPTSPAFLAGAGAIALTTVGAMIVYALLLRRAVKENKHA